MAQSVLRQLKETCARVKGPRLTGTGYLIAEGRLATAYHVVEPLQEGGQCEVLLGLDQTAYQARLMRVDQLADAAILAIGAGVAVAPLPVGHGVLTDDKWQAFGFPEIAKSTGVPLDGIVQDQHAHNDAGQPALLLFSRQIGSGSGAPLHGASALERAVRHHALSRPKRT